MKNTIRKGLLQFIFSGTYMKRWNDKLRPMELIEIDKQAHKMIVAWMLCQHAGRTMTSLDRLSLEQEVVEKGIFDYMFRLIVTDIKPAIFNRIRENHEHYQELAKWAVKEVEPHLRPFSEDFFERFERHVMGKDHSGIATDILTAAHTYSTIWEFRLFRNLNSTFDEELPEIDKRLQELEAYQHIEGVNDLLEGLQYSADKTNAVSPSAFATVANLCGQLRFQKRWSQTPRIPETSVMGHMFLVACFSFFITTALQACPARRVNAFFCGLFHDLPEVLTRDIISPVKKSFAELSRIIKQYEDQELERHIFSPLEKAGHEHITERLRYYLGTAVGSEFQESILKEGGKPQKVSFDELQGKYNANEFDPKDGKAIKLCDILAAYIEAYTAIRNGITSDQIQQAFWRIREEYSKETLGNIHLGALFTDFD